MNGRDFVGGERLNRIWEDRIAFSGVKGLLVEIVRNRWREPKFSWALSLICFFLIIVLLYPFYICKVLN